MRGWSPEPDERSVGKTLSHRQTDGCSGVPACLVQRRMVIGYRAKAADADTAEGLDDALTEHGVTADVPVRI